MTEENSRRILNYMKLKDKLISSKEKQYSLSPRFHTKNSIPTIDSFYSSANDTNNPLKSKEKINSYISPEKNNSKRIGNNVKKIEYLYSPRTSFILKQEQEDKLYHDLCTGFDPMSIKIIKSYFKERLGELTEIEFISILKNYIQSWHPDLPNREKIMVKLLSKLFKDIDLNYNEVITWEDFTEFLTSTSSNINKKRMNYDLRMYTNSKKNFENISNNVLISYSLYIEKYNIIGIVIENSSKIEFYNADTLKRVKAFIDVKKTQIDIDQIELKKFDIRAKEKIEHQNKKYKFKQLNKESRINSFSLKNIYSKDKIDKITLNIPKRLKRIKTPEKIKQEIQQINYNQDFEKKRKKFNEKLAILTTCFVNELDLLFVSSSNNKISAWQYFNDEFINVNELEDDIGKSENTYAVFDSVLPQYTLDWEPIHKRLYSGQADGKILVWELNKTKNIEGFTLDFNKAKKQREEEIKRKMKKYNFSNEFNKLLQLSNINSKKDIDSSDNKVKQDLLFSSGIKMLINIKKDMSRESVSCIKILGKMQMLAAGYYNGSVILWDTLLNEYRKFYNDQSTGIYQIEYNSIKNLLFTCGFDHSIYIYDPFIDGYCIQKLVGHNYSINSISCNKDNDEIISLDIIGNIKVWDLNNNYNFQTININGAIHYVKKESNNQIDLQNKISSNQKMIFLNKVNKILIYGEKVMIFSKESYNYPELCDNQSVLGCFYNHRTYLFYTICLKNIKLWNILNGKIVRIYEEFLPNNNCEITSFCTDKIKNKLFIGDNFGHIICMNLNYGTIIREFIPHKKEIRNLLYSDEDNLLICLSIDNIIKIHNEFDQKENEIKKEIYLESFDITTIEINLEYSHIIAGTKQGEIKYFDMIHLKFDSYIIDSEYKKRIKNDSVISTLTLDEYPICLICHESGINNFEIIPPHPYKFKYFSEFSVSHNIEQNNDIEKKSKIISISADKKNGILYLGDMQGYVNCYSIKKLLEIFDNISNEEIKEKLINLNKNMTKDIMDDNVKILKNFQIEFLFSFKAHNEPIKSIIFLDIYPRIIVTTGNDRKVKIYSCNGKYIDEFRQSMEKNKEIPIGIKCYLVDPFVSRINSDDIQEGKIVLRKDLEDFKFKKNKTSLIKMRNKNFSIFEYSNKVIEFNATERLYTLTKKCNLPNDRSTPWKYILDLDKMLQEERNEFDNKMKEIKNLELKYNLNNSYEILYNDSAYPKFFKDIDERKVKEFGDKLCEKIKSVKLAITNYTKNADEFESYKKQKKRMYNIDYKSEKKLIYGNKVQKIIKSQKIAKYEKEREYIMGKNKNKFKNMNKQFNFYKEDFNRNMEELGKRMENKLNLTYNKSNTNSQNTISDKIKLKYLIFKNIKKKLNPQINNNFISPQNKIIQTERVFKRNKNILKKVHFE